MKNIDEQEVKISVTKTNNENEVKTTYNFNVENTTFELCETIDLTNTIDGFF